MSKDKKKIIEEASPKKSISMRLSEVELDYLDGLAALVESKTGVPTNRTWIVSRLIILGGKALEREFNKK